MENKESLRQGSKALELVGIVRNIAIPIVWASVALGVYDLIPEGIKNPDPNAQILAKIGVAGIGALIWPAYNFCKKPKSSDYLNKINLGEK